MLFHREQQRFGLTKAKPGSGMQEKSLFGIDRLNEIQSTS